MDDRDANIDLLFRNGLKDYEVLPPAEVWDNISPAVRKQQRAYIILRAAAAVAVLLTLGFLSSTWNNEVNDRLMNAGTSAEPVILFSEPEVPDGPLMADAAALTTSSGKENGRSVRPVEISIGKENIPPDRIAVEIQPGLQDFSSENRINNAILTGSDNNLYEPFKEVSDNSSYPIVSLKEQPSGRSGRRWTVSALVSPTYLSSFQSETGENISQLGAVEQPVVSYAGGFAVSYKLNKRLSVQSGLYYSSYGNELEGITAYGGFQAYDMVKGNRNFEVATTNGTVYTNNSDIYLVDEASDARMSAHFDRNSFDPSKASLEYLDNSLRQNLSYLELPVILRYKLLDRAVDFNIIGGLSSNMLVNNTVYTTLDGSKYEVGTTGGLNSFTFSSSLGMGFEYTFTRNLSFNLEPTFRYFLNPYNNLEGTGGHPYSFGVFSGISYKF